MSKSDSPPRDAPPVIEDLSERPADGGTAVADLAGLRLMERDFEDGAAADGPTLVKPLAAAAAAAKSQRKEQAPVPAASDPAYDDLEASITSRSWWILPVLIGLLAGAAVIALWISFT
jgi:hypothetical protein